MLLRLDWAGAAPRASAAPAEAPTRPASWARRPTAPAPVAVAYASPSTAASPGPIPPVRIR